MDRLELVRALCPQIPDAGMDRVRYREVVRGAVPAYPDCRSGRVNFGAIRLGIARQPRNARNIT